MNSAIRGVVACLVVVALTAQVQGQPVYTLIDLGTLGGDWSKAYGINDSGQVVGQSRDSDGESFAFLWSEGTMTNLGTLDGHPSSIARGINNLGQVVGRASFPWRALLWSDGTMTQVSMAHSMAYDINDLGQIVGSASNSDGDIHAFLWSDGTATDLGTLGGFDSSSADGINNSGQVVGSCWSFSGGWTSKAFLWADGTMTDLGTLGGERSGAEAINNSGQIVGWAENSDGDAPAFLWSDGTMTELGTLGANWGVAWAINDLGQVVGTGAYNDEDAEEDWVAVLWSDGMVWDLNDLIAPDLGWKLMYAEDINNHGHIVGWGQYQGEIRAFLLVPEPGSIAMLGVAAAIGLGFVRPGRRRGRTS